MDKTTLPDQSELEADASIVTRLPEIAEEVLTLHREIYAEASRQYPGHVFADRHGRIILKQRGDYHSYSIVVHSQMVGGIMESILGTRLMPEETREAGAASLVFRAPGIQGLLAKIYSEADRSEENMLRQEIMGESMALAESLDLTDEEKSILAVEAYLHDTGKYLEEEIKDMEQMSALSLRRMRIEGPDKRTKLKNPIYSKLTEAEGSINDHDEYTIEFYASLLKAGILTEDQFLSLEKLHKVFTQFSLRRYDLSPEEANQFLTSLGTTITVSMALLVTVADELGKGVKFTEGKASEKRVLKLRNILGLIKLLRDRMEL